MSTLTHGIILVACLAALGISARVTIVGVVGLADRVRIPKMIAGIFLVALATSLPELAVSVLSALKGNPGIALGNAVGSVIVDDGLAMALAGIFAANAIAVHRGLLWRAGTFLITIDIVAFLFVLNGTLSRLEGGILLLSFFGFFAWMAKAHQAGEAGLFSEPESRTPAATTSLKGQLIRFLLGAGGVIVASHFAVESAVHIAEGLGVPEAIIAVTLVAFGTSVPEVATSVAAVRSGHAEVAVGNVIGSDVLNICWVAGASAVANPLSADPKTLWFLFPSMIIVALFMLGLMARGGSFTRANGFTMLGIYLVFLAIMGVTYLS